MPYYRVIGGVKYDNRILKAAEAVAAQPGHSKSVAIDQLRALPIVAAATDGKRVTDVESRTIKRVLDTYTFSADAKADLLALLTPAAPPAADMMMIGRAPDPPFFQCSTS